MEQFSRWLQILYRAGSRRRLLMLLTGLSLGIVSIGLGFALLILFIVGLVGDITQLTNAPLLGIIFVAIGGGLMLVSFVRLNEHMMNYVNPNRDGRSVLNLVYERMASADKPRVVVFSNGIGLFILLNALKDKVSSVDVVLPQGEDTQIYGELLQANNLNLRNVYISKIPNGTLCAEFNDGTVVEGVLSIKETRNKPSIRRLYVNYANGQTPDASTNVNDELVNALKNADAIIFGNFNLDYVILNTKRINYALAEKYYDYGAEQVLLNLDEFEHTYLKVDFSARLGEVRQLNQAVLIDDDLINASVQKILGQTDEKLVVRHDPDKLKAVFEKIFDHIEYRLNLSSNA